MKSKFALLLAVVALLAINASSQAGPVLTGGPLFSVGSQQVGQYTNRENLYDASGNYVKGNTAPAKGEYLVAFFNVTGNTVNGWAPNYSTTFGTNGGNNGRDTYTGISVAKITDVTTTGGVTTITLTAPTTGDVTTFNMNGYQFPNGTGGKQAADNSMIDVSTALDYSKSQTVAIFHQGDTAANSTVGNLKTYNGTVSSIFSNATAGTKFMAFDNLAANSYTFSTGTVPPPASALGLTSFEGLGISFNNTAMSGFTTVKNIGDPNVSGGTKTVPFYIESKINLNPAGQFQTPTPGTQHFDFASSDPFNINPTAVPEPMSVSLLVIGVGGLLSGAWVRRRRNA
jgi:hypothetical protein